MNNLDKIIELTHGKWPEDPVLLDGIYTGEFTKQQYMQRLKDLTGRPDVKDWPEWANYCAQDLGGKWFCFDIKPFLCVNSWDVRGCLDFFSKGGVITNKSWKSSLISREEAEMVDKENNDWLKPNIECEFNHPNFGWVECETIGWFRDKMVCAVNGSGFYQGYKDKFRPAISKKERVIHQITQLVAEQTRTLSGCKVIAKTIYSKIKSGEVKID